MRRGDQFAFEKGNGARPRTSGEHAPPSRTAWKGHQAREENRAATQSPTKETRAAAHTSRMGAAAWMRVF